MICSNCSAENREGSKFCAECGAPFSRACPSCGSPVAPAAKFCNECGNPVAPGSPHAAVRAPAGPPPQTERRLVSVLFADLVGFTTLSESRDPEDVRELLSRYFEVCRTVIARYGGVVEK